MKKKLKLSLEDLRVDSFATTPASDASNGTVRGHETQVENTCNGGCETYFTGGYCGCPTVYDCHQPTEGAECDTYWCANDSREGWASCGTTCQVPSCEPTCYYPTDVTVQC